MSTIVDQLWSVMMPKFLAATLLLLTLALPAHAEQCARIDYSTGDRLEQVDTEGRPSALRLIRNGSTTAELCYYRDDIPFGSLPLDDYHDWAYDGDEHKAIECPDSGVIGRYTRFNGSIDLGWNNQFFQETCDGVLAFEGTLAPTLPSPEDNILRAAAAADWRPYINARFGYSVDVPKGFVGNGEFSTGQLFRDTRAALLLHDGEWDIEASQTSFAEKILKYKDTLVERGWIITYETTSTTQAAYSGTRRDRVLYTRVIALCENTVNVLTLDYRREDLEEFDPIILRLVRSHRATLCP